MTSDVALNIVQFDLLENGLKFDGLLLKLGKKKNFIPHYGNTWLAFTKERRQRKTMARNNVHENNCNENRGPSLGTQSYLILSMVTC
jgi:hypothetical protein